MPRIPFVLLALLTWISCSGQDRQLIQGVVSGGITQHSARVIQDHLKARDGVLVCRVDPVSRNIMVIVEPGFGLNEDGLRHFLRIHGIALRCYRRSRLTDAPFHLMDPKSCGPGTMRQ